MIWVSAYSIKVLLGICETITLFLGSILVDKRWNIFRVNTRYPPAAERQYYSRETAEGPAAVEACECSDPKLERRLI